MKQLRSIIDRLQKKHIVIIDLRQEFHWFINAQGQWISFNLFEPNFPYNRTKDREAIVAQETQMCQEINNKPYVDILHITKKSRTGCIHKSEKLRIHRKGAPFCLTEEQLIKKYFSKSCAYYRVPLQDHCAPDDLAFKSLKKIIKKHPRSWIHLHCKGGAGRTSLMLLLIDILKHTHRFTFKEYVQRQIDRGGANLWKCKYRSRLERMEALYKQR